MTGRPVVIESITLTRHNPPLSWRLEGHICLRGKNQWYRGPATAVGCGYSGDTSVAVRSRVVYSRQQISYLLSPV